MDGVLRDSEKANIISGIKTFEKLGIHIKKKETDLIIGRHPDDYLKDFKKIYDFNEDEYNKLKFPMYYDMIKKIPINPETKPLLELLKKNNLKIALCSSSPKRGVYDYFIDKYNLGKYFDVVIAFEDISKRKPSPDSYLKALKKLKLKKDECIVIEDSEVGVEAAKKAGIKCIAIPNKWTKKGDFSKADIVLKSLKKITPELIKEIGGKKWAESYLEQME